MARTARTVIAAFTIIGMLIVLSMILVISTLFTGVNAVLLTEALFAAAGGAVLAIGGPPLLRSRRRRITAGGSADRLADVRQLDRKTWRMPPLDQLAKPVMSPLRKAGLLLRGYLIASVLLPARPSSAVARLGEQVHEGGRVARDDIDDLGVALRPGYQRDGAAADAECAGQRRLRRLAVHGPGAHADDQGTGMFAADSRMRRAGPHPDSDPHTTSVQRQPGWRGPARSYLHRPAARDLSPGLYLLPARLFEVRPRPYLDDVRSGTHAPQAIVT